MKYDRSNKSNNENIFKWDTENWSKTLELWRMMIYESFDGLKVLELGAGDGSLSIWTSNQGGDVICSDLSINDEKINTIKSQIVNTEKIKFESIDILDIPYTNYFDIILFKSVLGSLPSFNKQKLAFEQIHKALKNNGKLLFCENMKSTFIHQYFRSKKPWAYYWRYPSYNELIIMSKQFRKINYDTYGLIGAGDFPLKTFRVKIDYLSKLIFPNKWFYIFAGVYQK